MIVNVCIGVLFIFIVRIYVDDSSDSMLIVGVIIDARTINQSSFIPCKS